MSDRDIKLGIIGLSEGNGHPYSWSAIFNGYDSRYMDGCGYPVIPEYLAAQHWPDAQIGGAFVTHIWTQSEAKSEHIAKAVRIPHIVSDPVDMIGHVDAILLARDDAESHFTFAQPFVDAGLPVYIDKPIALSLSDLRRIYNLERYEGQIFTCSALRYASELRVTSQMREDIGVLRHVEGCTSKSWAKYSAHIIEPMLNIIGSNREIASLHSVPIGCDGQQLVAQFEGGVSAAFSALGNSTAGPLVIRVFGDMGWHELVFKDSFSAFRAALQDFINGVRAGACRSRKSFNKQVVRLIEAGSAA